MGKRNKKYQYPKCPCCGVEKHRTEMAMAISDLKKLEKSTIKHYNELGLDPYDSFIESDFDWACDSCFTSKKAIKANPKAQNYCWNPFYAYFDSVSTCRNCNNEFTFGKKEKKFWYENLKFWIESVPVNCTQCRKDIRKQKLENKKLSDILKKQENEINNAELETIISIYEEWGKENLLKYYQSILKKRNKTNAKTINNK